MQSFIDFLVNNYLWFIIISLILIFALIGYLVDTNEKKNKENMLDGEVDAPSTTNIKIESTTESANMDMGVEEDNGPQKGVIITPSTSNIEVMTPNPEEVKETETLDI